MKRGDCKEAPLKIEGCDACWSWRVVGFRIDGSAASSLDQKAQNFSQS